MGTRSSKAAVVFEDLPRGEAGSTAHLSVVANNGVTKQRVRWTLQRGFIGRVVPGRSPLVSRRELSALRGRVFYAEGRRPQFISANGEFADEDEQDFAAFHLIGSTGAVPVAACRMVRFRDVAMTDFERRVGSRVIEQVLGALQVGRGDAAEVSRWVVDPRFRQEGLGALLIAGMWVLAAHLRILAALAWAGTRDGQAHALMAMGGSPISGVTRIKSEAWDDELQALSFDPYRPATQFQSWVCRMGDRLKLPDVSWAR